MAIAGADTADLGNGCSCLCLGWVYGKDAGGGEKAAAFTHVRGNVDLAMLGMMEQIWFVNAPCSVGHSLVLFPKQKVSMAKDNALQ